MATLLIKQHRKISQALLLLYFIRRLRMLLKTVTLSKIIAKNSMAIVQNHEISWNYWGST